MVRFHFGSLYFYHMISVLDPCIFTTWFFFWFLVFLHHDLHLRYFHNTIFLLDPCILSHDFPSWNLLFYHMSSLLDSRSFAIWFPSVVLIIPYHFASLYFYHKISLWIHIFLPDDVLLRSSYYIIRFPFGTLYLYHTIFLLDTRIFTSWFPPWILAFITHDLLLGSPHFCHIISLFDPCIFVTWFPSWILLFSFTRQYKECGCLYVSSTTNGGTN